MLIMSDITRAFPLPIYEKTLQDDFSILEGYKNYGVMDSDDGYANTTNLCPVRVLELPELYGVKETINWHFGEFLSELGIQKDKDFVMTTSWFVCIKQGGQVHTHNHTNCWFSGLLYFDLDYTDAVALQLQNPHSLNSLFAVEMNEEWMTSSAHVIYPSHNLLVFFPSHLNHKSNIQTNIKPRYSLAFNFFPKGKVGDIGSDSYLDTAWLNS